MPLEPGQVLGDRFDIVGEVGRGGTATVWLARDRVRDERVALKVLHAHLADDPTVRTRLTREVEAAQRVDHPGALVARALHDLEGHLVLELPFHPGVSLGAHVAEHGPWTGEHLVRLGKRLAAALGAAHRAGVVHRDVTPNNVLVDADEDAVLTDFGLARVDGRHTATATSVMGTPGFVAPELFDGHRADARSDLYGLGATLFVAATGTPPFGSGPPGAVLRRQMGSERPRLAELRPDLPEALTATVDALLDPDPEDRPASARDVEDLLSGKRSIEAVVRTPKASTTPRPHLPPGHHRVVVKGRRMGGARPTTTWPPKGHRSKTVKRWKEGHRWDRDSDTDERPRWTKRRRGKHGDFFAKTEHLAREVGRLVDGTLDVATTTVERLQEVITPRPEQTPEGRLAAAVARRAHLPDDALRPSHAFSERRFRLVEGVDERTATQLQVEAREAGWNASVEDVEDDAEVARKARRALFLPFVLPAFIIWVTPAPDWIATMILGIGFILWLATRLGAAEVTLGAASFALAYGHDLRPHLAPAYAGLLPPPLEDAPAPKTNAERRAAHKAKLAAREAAAKGEVAGPPPRLVDQVRARLDGLRDRLDEADLPSAIEADLAASLKALGTEADRLDKHLVQLDAALAQARPDATVEAAVASLQGRIRRLETLARDGQHTSDAELERLRGAMAEHLEDLAATEELEGRRVEIVARLLELGAVVADVQQELFASTGQTQALDAVVAEVRRETKAAAAALDEVDRRDAARRAQARAASRG